MPSREQRKSVTVLFCDLTGSTALGETLDPERLRSLLASYFERMKAIVERHGGTVEKFIAERDGCRVVVHEDDALGVGGGEMRDALPELGLQGRIGVMTGEVVTGTEERLATGDAVNVAARLEQAAQPGEVLIGQPTLALVRDATDVEPVEPLEAEGQAEPIPPTGSCVCTTRRSDGTTRGSSGASASSRSYERHGSACRAERRCELVTVIGDDGVGKSRLAAELLARSRRRSSEAAATLRRGDHVLAGSRGAEAARSVASRGGRREAIGSLLGEREETTTAEEIAWAYARHWSTRRRRGRWW